MKYLMDKNNSQTQMANAKMRSNAVITKIRSDY